ncbi:hypothetical protein IWX90DRAFT_237704 [Phyllosticta citrichinensis]|uniref:Secreted protein n=1 Tax=Phyllosticta citrichinensis TaxID=1130410 RepID=A0ABR1XQE5_9PEZI
MEGSAVGWLAGCLLSLALNDAMMRGVLMYVCCIDKSAVASDDRSFLFAPQHLHPSLITATDHISRHRRPGPAQQTIQMTRSLSVPFLSLAAACPRIGLPARLSVYPSKPKCRTPRNLITTTTRTHAFARDSSSRHRYRQRLCARRLLRNVAAVRRVESALGTIRSVTHYVRMRR